MLFSTLFLGISSLALTSALQPLTIKGSKFFNADGSQFYMKGIAYQRSPQDPLVDAKQCQMDSKLMAELGANIIRVYHVDPLKNHDACMKAFDDNGIYMLIDLDTFHTQIEQDGPPHWNQTQLTAFTDVLDAFVKYDNVAGYFVGNEIITSSSGSWAAPYIKSAVRDVKSYIKSKKYSKPVYVGYSAADISQLRPNLANYLACGTDASVNIDFFGLNAYEWCGVSDYKLSGYDQLEKNATGYAVPIFFSETGCNSPKPRTFEDQTAIFGPEMSDTWSGAIVYEWIQEANSYGIISYAGTVNTATAVGGDPYVRDGTPVPVTPDFANLSKVWATITPTGVKMAEYTPSSTSNTCPPMTTGEWNVDPASPLPSLGQVAKAGDGSAAYTSTTGGVAAAATSSPANGAGQVSINFGILASFLALVFIL